MSINNTNDDELSGPPWQPPLLFLSVGNTAMYAYTHCFAFTANSNATPPNFRGKQFSATYKYELTYFEEYKYEDTHINLTILCMNVKV